MSYPSCPDPSHTGSHVVRAGWNGKAPYRRQRWKCVPGDGSPAHEFVEALPRRATEETYCSECSSRLDPWEGQAGPRWYLYDAREIAHALALVARGESYRRTALEVRDTERKAEWARPSSAAPKRKDSTGQIIANWVDIFAPVVLEAEMETEWPTRIAIDSVGFRVGGSRNLRELHIFVAIGYDRFGARPCVWLMRPYPKKNTTSWLDFFGRLSGAPELIVSDMDGAIMKAVGIAFPPTATSTTRQHWCELHTVRSLIGVLRTIPAIHPIRDAFRGALRGQAEWAAFEHQVRLEYAKSGRPRTAMRWLDRCGPQLRAQTAMRGDYGPYGIGAVEATNREIKSLLDQRAHRLGNRHRTEHLLDLLICGINGRVDERAWAKRVRLHLEARGGVPEQQRPHDDPLGMPSLYA